jgi:hypothetical protein
MRQTAGMATALTFKVKLSSITPQAICDAWTRDRSIFKINPNHLIPGPNT